MTPDEVIEQLKKIGVEMSRPSLTRYEKQGLIPKPERGALGRGRGRWTNYPPETVAEAYAAWGLLHGKYGFSKFNKKFFEGNPPKLSPALVASIRQSVMEKREIEDDYSQVVGSLDPKDVAEIYGNDISEEELKERAEFEEELARERESWTDQEKANDAAQDHYNMMWSALEQFFEAVWEWEVKNGNVKLSGIKKVEVWWSVSN